MPLYKVHTESKPVERDGIMENAREGSDHCPTPTSSTSTPSTASHPAPKIQARTSDTNSRNITTTTDMFCSPIQQVDPFSFFSPSPYHTSYHHPQRRHYQSYNDPVTAALLQEQARRQAAYERRRAYEEQEEARRENALRRARAIHAQKEYERQMRNLFLQGYRPAGRYDEEEMQEQLEEEAQQEHDVPQSSHSQSYIPIHSSTPAQSSNEENAGADEESQAEEDTEYEADDLNEEEQQISPSERQSQGKPTITYNEAVAIVHKYAPAALAIRRRLRSLDRIRDKFGSQQRSFQPPRTLDFDMPKSTKAGQPVLSYTPNNRPLQAYEENLLRLLTDLDDVPSGGLERIKKARKALAKDINDELSRIDSYKARLWQRR